MSEHDIWLRPVDHMAHEMLMKVNPRLRFWLRVPDHVKLLYLIKVVEKYNEMYGLESEKEINNAAEFLFLQSPTFKLMHITWKAKQLIPRKY